MEKKVGLGVLWSGDFQYNLNGGGHADDSSYFCSDVLRNVRVLFTANEDENQSLFDGEGQLNKSSKCFGHAAHASLLRPLIFP